MANIIIGSEFKPFSYEEMLAPIMLALQAHQLIEDAYSELETKASIWDKMASEENDPIAHNTYKLYARDLLYQANSLAQNGLTPGARKKMLSLKSRYASDIAPIELAYARRKELQDEQRKALLLNPTLMFERDFNNIGYESSLDRFVENPLYDYGLSYSGALLTQQSATMAANLAKELVNYGKGKPIDKYTDTFIKQHGYTRELVLDAITNPNRASSQPVLNSIRESVMGMSGMSGWADNPTLNKAYSYIDAGLWSAIGLTDVSTMTNFEALLAAKEASERRLAAYKKSLDGPTSPGSKRPLINPRALRNLQELSKLATLISENSLYFTQDGLFTNKGLNQLRKEIALYKKDLNNPSFSSYGINPTKGSLYSLIESMGIPLDKNFTVLDINTAFATFKELSKLESYDTYHSTEYVRLLDDKYATEVNRQVASASTLHLVEFLGKNGWKETKIDKSALKDYTPTSINYSKYGDTITYTVTDRSKSNYGDTIRVKMPSSINARVQLAMAAHTANADVYNLLFDLMYNPNFYQPEVDNYGNIRLDEKGNVVLSNIPMNGQIYSKFINDFYDELDNIYTTGAMYVTPSSTNETPYPVYEFGR